jgi:CIC family chloride channel protein
MTQEAPRRHLAGRPGGDGLPQRHRPGLSLTRVGGRFADLGLVSRTKVHRELVAALGRRTRLVVLFAALTGLVTGVGVAGFEELTRDALFDHLVRAPLALQLAGPLVGLLVSALVIRVGARAAGPATADEYIKAFHDTGRRLDLRPVPAKLVASVATLGLGGAMGYEGPSIYLGAAAGSSIQRRFARWFSLDDAKVLLVAGAAAGVAAIFKAPVTGLVFALEVPYQDDLARRMLLPAGIAAAVSYTAFVAISGTAPLFEVSGSPPFDFRAHGGAALLGVLSGVGANAFVRALRWAKHFRANWHPLLRAAVGGAGLAGLATLAWWALDAPMTLGAGYDNIQWAVEPHRALGLVVLLLALRTAAVIATVAGGGVGGLFIPLVVEGALLGRVVSGLVHGSADSATFFPIVGVAAFLGAGYRVPLAGVVFAAEATGRPGFIVPGMIAAMVAQLFMGRASASPYQAAARVGHLERRFRLPVSAALRTDGSTIPPDTTLAEFFQQNLLGRRETVVPVVDGNRYLGVMRIDELQATPSDRWATELVADHLRADQPTAPPTALLLDALADMDRSGTDVLPIVEDGSFVGVVTIAEVLRLEDILERTAAAAPPDAEPASAKRRLLRRGVRPGARAARPPAPT